jgi:shikimate dehydrogenase
MQLVALLGSGPSARALARYRDPEMRVWLHPVPSGSLGEAVRALPLLGFAGALVFGEEGRQEAARAVARRSLDAEEQKAVDAVAVAGDATVGDHVGGRAVVEGLRRAGWDPRGARVVALGDGPAARAVVRELAAAGAEEVTFVARDAPTAEQAVPALPTGVRARGLAVHDPALATLLERCDALLRSEDLLAPAAARLGPHLTVVDLVPGLDAAWRRDGRAAGATAVPWADVEAHRVAAALRAVMGGDVDAEPLLELLHDV